MKVIITDTQYRKAFDTANVVRSYGYSIVPTFSKKNLWNQFKLFCGFPERVRLLRTNSIEVFRKDLLSLIQKETAGAQCGKGEESCLFSLIASEESTVELLSQYPELLESVQVKVLLPDNDSFNRVVDKYSLMEFCAASAIDAPFTYFNKGSLDDFFSTSEHDEWVVKPRRGTGAAGVRYLKTKECLNLPHETLANHVVQEKIPSKHGVQGGFFLCHDGRVVASYSHERIRTYPESGGVTVYSKFKKNLELERLGAELLAKLHWTGFAMIECIEDSRDGKLKVIEINPRLWGSLLLGEFAGASLIGNYLNICGGRKAVLHPTINEDSHIRWPFPYDLLLWLKQRKQTKVYWKNPHPTCFINWTYCNRFRGFCFQMMNVVDPTNIFKFLKRRMGIGG